MPFIFNQNATPRTPHPSPWAPPPLFSPEKAFPNPPEPNDIDMSEASPNKIDELKPETGRAMASGALRRVWNKRQKSRDIRPARRLRQEDDDDTDVFDSDDEEDRALMAQSTSNHYTLNLPAAPPPQSDLPYILLGYVFFFLCRMHYNLSER